MRRAERLSILGLFLLLAATPFLARGDGANPWLERRVLNMAHRGGRAEDPEHTLYAYTVALPKGVNTLEIDVQRTADGVLVVHHDRWNARARWRFTSRRVSRRAGASDAGS